MPRALEIIGFQATAPGATATAFAAVAGNSLTIRDSRRDVKLVAQTIRRQTAGFHRITSPSLHDNTFGIQFATSASNGYHMFMPAPQILRPQDTLTVVGTGSATAGDIESGAILLRYDDLPGVDANLIDTATLRRRMRNLFMTFNTVSAGTSGGWSGSEAINVETDAFKANTEYALLGISVSQNAACSIRVVGPDWGNLGIGVPARTDTGVNSDMNYFQLLSDATGEACIPVMNSANKALTTIDCLQDENGADPVAVLHWAELK